jgi:hypothetical protein
MTAEDMVLGITGATDAVRGKVAARLVESGHGQRLIVRVESRTPDLLGAEGAEASYDDPEAIGGPWPTCGPSSWSRAARPMTGSGRRRADRLPLLYRRLAGGYIHVRP